MITKREIQIGTAMQPFLFRYHKPLNKTSASGPSQRQPVDIDQILGRVLQ